MLYNYFLTGIRNLWKNKGINIINVLGLGLALSCCILEYCFVRFYNTMDTCHVNADRIYMVTTVANREGVEKTWGDSPQPIGNFVQQSIPQMKRYARLQAILGDVKIKEVSFSESVTFTDKDFLSIFSFPLLEGSQSALDKAGVVLSYETAIKLFGKTRCLNENFEIYFPITTDSSAVLSFSVKAVADKLPKNASFGFTILAPIAQLTTLGIRDDDWKQTVQATFIEVESENALHEFANAKTKLLQLRNDAQPEWPVKDFGLEPLLTLSKNTHAITNDIARGISPVSKTVMLILASLLMLLAIFNFINVSLSNGTRRLKEIGYRKAAGALRSQIVFQFLTENFIVSLLGLVIGLLLAKFFILPGFSAIGPAQLELDFLNDPLLTLFMFAILLVTTLGGAGFPALFVSKFNAVEIFKGTLKLGSQNLFNRLVLGVQFFLAFVTVAAGVVFVQNDVYQRQRDWGYNKANAIAVPVSNEGSFRVLRNQLLQLPQIERIAGSEHQVGSSSTKVSVEYESAKKMISEFRVGFGYIETLRMELQEGRLFDEKVASDSTEAIVVNELFVKSMGIKDPLNQQVKVDSTLYSIVGVVSNFHYQDFLKEIQPALFRITSDRNFRYLTARSNESASGQLAVIEKIWNNLFPNEVFMGRSQDTVFDEYFYVLDAQTTVILFTTLVSLLLATTGLFGVTSMRLSTKMKALSIRKVLGATGKDLSLTLSKEVIILLAIAIVLAAPLAFYYLDSFLRVGYKYPTTIGAFTWVAAITFMCLIVLLTILSILLKTMRINPAELLRAE